MKVQQSSHDLGPAQYARFDLDQPRLKPWEPGFRKHLPWSGLAALTCGLLCAILTAVILFSSHGNPTELWPVENYTVQPAVLLALVTTTANVLLHYALQEGVTIAWWLKALKGGDINDLHHYWAYGTSLQASMTSGRRFNTVALACILTSLLAINGPLLQRSTSVETQLSTNHVMISAPLSTDELPTGYSGVYMTQKKVVSMLTPDFAQVAQQYTARMPMALNATGCDGDCTTVLTAAGFDFNCTKSYKSVNYDLTEPVDGMEFDIGHAFVRFDGNKNSGAITLETLYKADASCSGELTRHICHLQTAIVEYPVRISGGNGTVKLIDTPSPNTNSTLRLTYPPPESSSPGLWPSTIGGIALAAQHIYASNITSRYNSTYELLATGTMASTYINCSLALYNTCNVSWTDPMPGIRLGIREMTFRAALAASASGEGIPRPQVVSAVETLSRTYYVSYYSYLLAAVVLTVLSSCVIAPLFLGFWHLGRAVSLSPIETAKAFRAPLLHGTECNGDINVLLRDVGARKARYGAIVCGGPAESPGGLGPGGRAHTWSTQDAQISLYRSQSDLSRRPPAGDVRATRLQIADPRLVARPVEGAVYRDRE